MTPRRLLAWPLALSLPVVAAAQVSEPPLPPSDANTPEVIDLTDPKPQSLKIDSAQPGPSAEPKLSPTLDAVGDTSAASAGPEVPPPSLPAAPAPTHKAPISPGKEPKALAPEKSTGRGLEWRLGYDSQENFRGQKLAENIWWTEFSGTVPLTRQLELGVNSWYASKFDADYQELNLGAGLVYDANSFKLGLGYTWYYYPDGSVKPYYTGDDTSEVGLSIGTSIGPVTIHGGYYYDFGAGGQYIDVGADYGVRLCSTASLELGADLGYGIDYYAQGDGWNHLSLRAAVPISLTPTITLTPYVAVVFPLDQLSDRYDTELFGGIRLTINF